MRKAIRPTDSSFKRRQREAVISKAIATLYRVHFDRAPSNVIAHLLDDLLVCVLFGAFAPSDAQPSIDCGSEQNSGGQQFQWSLETCLCTAIEEITARRVDCVVSGTNQGANVLTETFIFTHAEPLRVGAQTHS